MSKPTKITIHMEDVHSCGQVIAQVVTMDLDKELSITHERAVLPGFEGGLSTDYTFWIPPVFAKPVYTISGHYSKVDITGVEFKEHSLRCVKCGVDILFSERDVK